MTIENIQMYYEPLGLQMELGCIYTGATERPWTAQNEYRLYETPSLIITHIVRPSPTLEDAEALELRAMSKRQPSLDAQNTICQSSHLQLSASEASSWREEGKYRHNCSWMDDRVQCPR